LAERSLCRHTPEVGAVCGKAARTVLCGGREVTRVPTASPRPYPDGHLFIEVDPLGDGSMLKTLLCDLFGIEVPPLHDLEAFESKNQFRLLKHCG
jgi:hypothetical protein